MGFPCLSSTLNDDLLLWMRLLPSLCRAHTAQWDEMGPTQCSAVTPKSPTRQLLPCCHFIPTIFVRRDGAAEESECCITLHCTSAPPARFHLLTQPWTECCPTNMLAQSRSGAEHECLFEDLKFSALPQQKEGSSCDKSMAARSPLAFENYLSFRLWIRQCFVVVLMWNVLVRLAEAHEQSIAKLQKSRVCFNWWE